MNRIWASASSPEKESDAENINTEVQETSIGKNMVDSLAIGEVAVFRTTGGDVADKFIEGAVFYPSIVAHDVQDGGEVLQPQGNPNGKKTEARQRFIPLLKSDKVPIMRLEGYRLKCLKCKMPVELCPVCHLSVLTPSKNLCLVCGVRSNLTRKALTRSAAIRSRIWMEAMAAKGNFMDRLEKSKLELLGGKIGWVNRWGSWCGRAVTRLKHARIKASKVLPQKQKFRSASSKSKNSRKDVETVEGNDEVDTELEEDAMDVDDKDPAELPNVGTSKPPGDATNKSGPRTHQVRNGKLTEIDIQPKPSKTDKKKNLGGGAKANDPPDVVSKAAKSKKIQFLDPFATEILHPPTDGKAFDGYSASDLETFEELLWDQKSLVRDLNDPVLNDESWKVWKSWNIETRESVSSEDFRLALNESLDIHDKEEVIAFRNFVSSLDPLPSLSLHMQSLQSIPNGPPLSDHFKNSIKVRQEMLDLTSKIRFQQGIESGGDLVREMLSGLIGGVKVDKKGKGKVNLKTNGDAAETIEDHSDVELIRFVGHGVESDDAIDKSREDTTHSPEHRLHAKGNDKVANLLLGCYRDFLGSCQLNRL
ncbi:hypothetical protein HDU97_009531 [Phlyctochytrium planicorne]|nr:hypothetical protein HDU97_009531 [Phlyctochytrium planicorne]